MSVYQHVELLPRDVGEDGKGGPAMPAAGQSPQKVAFAMMVGTALETYDFMLYGIAASLIFNRLFFVSANPVVATMGAFATFAVGFAMRPLGAVIFGHLGDRIGRRACLIATVVIIGVATGIIGLLPGYHRIGIAAPVILTLLRMIQGIAVGGEWGGAMTLAVEHAPAESRARLAAMVQQGGPIGMLMGTGAFFLVALLPSEQFDSWGWRLPFLSAIPLLLVALWLRRAVNESPDFARMRAEDHVPHGPVRDVLTKSLPQLLIGAGACLLGIGGYYLASSYLISYGTSVLGISRSVMLAGTMMAGLGQIAIVVVVGRMAARIGSARVIVIGAAATILFAFPMFAMVESREPWLVILGMTIGIAGIYSPLAAVGPLLVDLFPVDRRYSGLGLCANLAGILSGFVPMLATALQAITAGSWSVALLLMLLAAATMVSALIAPRFYLPDRR